MACRLHKLESASAGENIVNEIEVQLFYIEDENSVVEEVLPGFANNRSVDKRTLLKTCISSIRKKNPNAEITFLTNSGTKFHHGLEGISIIENDDIKPSTLIYDLNVFRRNYIEANKNTNKKVFFTDIDVLINCELAPLFEKCFDIQTAIWKNSPYQMNSQGLPNNSLMFHFTGGGFFVKCNKKSLAFFDDYLALWKNIHETETFKKFGNFGPDVKKNFLTWWGEIYTFCIMVGPEVLSGKKNEKIISTCKFNFLDEDIFNFAPSFETLIVDDLHSMNLQLIEMATNLREKQIIHFRGGRKIFMEEIFKRMQNRI